MKSEILIIGGKVFTGSQDEKAIQQNILIKNGRVHKISKDPISVNEEVQIIYSSSTNIHVYKIKFKIKRKITT